MSFFFMQDRAVKQFGRVHNDFKTKLEARLAVYNDKKAAPISHL